MPPNDARPAWPRWLPVLVYFIATSLGHLEFTLWLLHPRSNAWWGSYAFKDAVPALLVATGCALLLWIFDGVRRQPRSRGAAAWYWGAWIFSAVLVDRFLTYSIYEYAHYPQYALLAWLVARALDPDRSRMCAGRVLFWTTLLGMVDEVMQYLWITPSYGNYIDFNDFFVNLLAGAAGMMLYYGRTPAPQRPAWTPPWAELAVALGLALWVAWKYAAGRLQLSPDPAQSVPAGGWATGADGIVRLYMQRAAGWYGSWQRGPRHGVYLVMTPGWGAALMALACVAFAQYPALPWRRRDL